WWRAISCSCAATWRAAEALRSADLCGQLDGGELDTPHQPTGFARVDKSRPQAPRGLRPAGHAEAHALIGSAPLVAGGQVAGEEGVARAALGDRLTGGYARPLQLGPTVDQHEGKA